MLNLNKWSPPSGLGSQNLLVVAYTDHYFGESFGKHLVFPKEWNVDLKCEFSHDRSRLAEADAVWFHAPSVSELPKKRAGQTWIMMSMESTINYPFLLNQKVMGLFELHMTYRLDSDIPTPYPSTGLYGDFLKPSQIEFTDKRETPLLFVASNPVAQRDQFVRELSKHIAIDCPGKCMNNQHIAEFSNHGSDGNTKLRRLIQEYKFYLALENSTCTDYATEKLYMPLAEGTVPVYRGADNLNEMTPSNKSTICIDDYATPKLLAEYLIHLGHDRQTYEEHLRWKKDGCNQSFRQLSKLTSIEPLLRMFIKLAHQCDRSCACGGRLR